jgi:hypothetical protein
VQIALLEERREKKRELHFQQTRASLTHPATSVGSRGKRKLAPTVLMKY